MAATSPDQIDIEIDEIENEAEINQRCALD